MTSNCQDILKKIFFSRPTYVVKKNLDYFIYNIKIAGGSFVYIPFSRYSCIWGSPLTGAHFGFAALESLTLISFIVTTSILVILLCYCYTVHHVTIHWSPEGHCQAQTFVVMWLQREETKLWKKLLSTKSGSLYNYLKKRSR